MPAPSPARRPRLGRAAASLLAGGVGITINTAALAAAGLVPLQTAQGGLLRLLVRITGVAIPAGPVFGTAFHIATGLAMALVYGFVLEPWLSGPPWLRGSAYAAAVWLANAALVLPAIGEGFAGRCHLSLAGMLWFAAAHAAFFIVTAVGYARLRMGHAGDSQPAAGRGDPARRPLP